MSIIWLKYIMKWSISILPVDKDKVSFRANRETFFLYWPLEKKLTQWNIRVSFHSSFNIIAGGTSNMNRFSLMGRRWEWEEKKRKMERLELCFCVFTSICLMKFILYDADLQTCLWDKRGKHLSSLRGLGP